LDVAPIIPVWNAITMATPPEFMGGLLWLWIVVGKFFPALGTFRLRRLRRSRLVRPEPIPSARLIEEAERKKIA
jgi:hypothetical protein